MQTAATVRSTEDPVKLDICRRLCSVYDFYYLKVNIYAVGYYDICYSIFVFRGSCCGFIHCNMVEWFLWD